MLFKDLILGQRFLLAYEVTESKNKKSATWLPVIFWYTKTGPNSYQKDSVYKFLKPNYKVSWKVKTNGTVHNNAEVLINEP